MTSTSGIENDVTETLRRLSPRDRELVEALDRHPDLTEVEIGAKIGMSVSSIRIRLKRIYREFRVRAQPGTPKRYKLWAKLHPALMELEAQRVLSREIQQEGSQP